MTRRGQAAVLVTLAALAAIVCAAEPARGQEPAAAFEAANEAYAAGDFATAVAGYRALLAAGHDHAMLYYNLGNAHLRRGEIGHAIASLRRAAAAAPRNPDVRANLAFARKNARDALAPPEPSAVTRTVFAWHHAFSRDELWLAAGVLNAMLWTLLACRLWRRHEAPRRREGLAWAAAATAVLLAASAGSLTVHAIAPLRVAVVLPGEVDARSGTREDSVVRFKLHAGSEVRLREERDGWLRIALPDGEQGWIEADAAEVVEL